MNHQLLETFKTMPGYLDQGEDDTVWVCFSSLEDAEAAKALAKRYSDVECTDLFRSDYGVWVLNLVVGECYFCKQPAGKHLSDCIIAPGQQRKVRCAQCERDVLMKMNEFEVGMFVHTDKNGLDWVQYCNECVTIEANDPALNGR